MFTQYLEATRNEPKSCPHLLCFGRVDNLRAYSIPSETGLLIPSVTPVCNIEQLPSVDAEYPSTLKFALEAIMATQHVQGVQQPFQTRLGSPYCCDPTCKSCEALRDEYDHLKRNESREPRSS